MSARSARGTRGGGGALGAVVTAATALACGSSPNGPALSALEFCAQERDQTAAFSARCLGGSAADWKAYRDAYMPCSRFDELIAAGTVRYHPELAAGCLEAQSADRDCSAPDNFCFVKTWRRVSSSTVWPSRF